MTADNRYGHLATYIAPQHIIIFYTLWRDLGRKLTVIVSLFFFLFIPFHVFPPSSSDRRYRCWFGSSTSRGWFFWLSSSIGGKEGLVDSFTVFRYPLCRNGYFLPWVATRFESRG